MSKMGEAKRILNAVDLAARMIDFAEKAHGLDAEEQRRCEITLIAAYVNARAHVDLKTVAVILDEVATEIRLIEAREEDVN